MRKGRIDIWNKKEAKGVAGSSRFKLPAPCHYTSR